MSPTADPFAAFCGQLYEASRLPLAISDAEGRYLSFWPELSTDFISRRVAQLVLQDFALQHRDETHPLILYNEPGFFTGILRLPDGRYCLAGPAGPLPHSREEVLAFGDSLNDLSMLEYAGHSVAVGNARIEVKEAADEVCLANDEDGVATYLEQMLFRLKTE